jgi:hypothetical protein
MMKLPNEVIIIYFVWYRIIKATTTNTDNFNPWFYEIQLAIKIVKYYQAYSFT